ncbi:MAG: penicillin-binding protein 1A, partial [Enterobacterales bacterium]
MTNKYLTKFTKIVSNLSLFAFLGAFLVFIACYLYVGPQLPAVETLKDIRLQTPMSVFTADNQLLAQFGEKRRIPVSYTDIPEKLNQALIATEDKRFFSHGGVDAMGFARSVFQILSTGRKGGGGSTITMQLARNFFLTFDTTFVRKTKEIFLSWKIERALSKEEILTLYWNKIDFSNRAHGVGAAAQVYYGTTIDKLTLPQLAILAGIPKGPTTHNPLANPKKAFNRRNHVLNRMQIEGYIDELVLAESIAAPLSATYHGSRVTVRAPYLAEMVRSEMVSQFGKDKAYTSGFKVYTTLQSKLQKVSRKSLRESLVTYDRRHGFRGAERHFNAVENELLTLEQDNINISNVEPQDGVELIKTAAKDFSTVDTELMDSILNDIPILGDLKPAMVLSISEKAVQVLLKKADRLTPIQDRLVTINWDGLSWARPFINESRRGKRPRTASEILKPGDMIRTYQDQEGNWQLTQLPKVSAAFVALTPKDGAIVSLVGGFDYDLNKFNNVVQARRQPGSNIKPFIYSASLEKGYTAASVVNDAP